VDDRNVTHHKLAREYEHDVPLGRYGRRPCAATQGRRGQAPGGQIRSLQEAAKRLAEGMKGVGKKRKGGSAVVWTPARAAIRHQLVMTRRPLLGEAGERVIGLTREGGGPAVAPEDESIHRPGRQTQARRAIEVKSKSDRVRGEDVAMVSNQIETGLNAQE
jgi:hypothetical protein